MSSPNPADRQHGSVAARADELFRQHQQLVFRGTDRLFVGLLIVQWLAAVAVAYWVAPLTWAGLSSRTNPHVWAALCLGGLIVSFPVALGLARPGRPLTRHVIALGQVLLGALLIHLTGGRIETHFHVFGSLAFLAIYRDWRVLLTATIAVAGDHFLRGWLWPESVYGVAYDGGWRWFEHAFWVLFEDAFLIPSCMRGVAEMHAIAERQAGLEGLNADIEATVERRTAELRLLHGLTAAIAEAPDERGALEVGMRKVCEATGWPVGQAWLPGPGVELARAAVWARPGAGERLVAESGGQRVAPGEGLPGRVFSARRHSWFPDVSKVLSPTLAPLAAADGLRAGLGIPILAGDEVLAVIEFFAAEPSEEDRAYLDLIFGAAAQLGNVLLRKRAEEEARRSAANLSALVENTADPVWSVDAGLRLLTCNASFRQGFAREFAARAPAGATPPDPADAAERSRWEQWYTRALSGERFVVEYRHDAQDGDRFFDVSFDPIAANGAVTGVSVFASDVTARRAVQEALRQAKEAAEAASRAKSEFLANMSHEIRTPMNGILGLTDLALHSELTEEQRGYLGGVKTSAEALLRIINDILDFSKIEAGKLDVEAVDFSLRETLASAMRTLAQRAHEKGLELAWYVAPDVPDAVVGDPFRLRQILINLAGNAVKFTERGEVVLGAHAESIGGEGATLHFTVRDTGIGIPPDKLERVFAPFEQADGSMTRRYGGTGLGLTISARLVRMMGGRVWVESTPGLGSTFHFTARFGRTHAPPAAPAAPAPVDLRGLPVLVVDDNATNRTILQELLSRWDMRPTAVDGAEAALGALSGAEAAGRPYRLVLLDVQMPGMDGFTLAERIRERYSRVTIMMLTSVDQGGAAARCRALDIASHLVKPIDPSELLNSFYRALQPAPAPRGASPAAGPAVATPPRQALRVLLAEDNAINQLVAVEMLKRQGHEVEIAGNGHEALAALERGTFDVVLMDVQMPVMDGFEATAALRAREAPGGPHTPVIALTAHAMTGDRERCLAAGMDGYLSKPMQPAALERELAAVVPRAAAPPVAPSAVSDGRNGHAPNGAPVLDRAAVLGRLGNDRGLVRRVTELFLGDCPRLLAALREASDGGDAAALARAAHTLKGALGNLGAVSASRAALVAEEAGRRGDLAAAAASVAALDEAAGQFRDALLDWGREDYA